MNRADYFSHQGHYWLSWGDGPPFNFEDQRENPTLSLKVHFGKIQRRVLSFRDECIETAKLLVKSAGSKKISIFLSGGIDSEVICRSLKTIDANFKAVTCRYSNNFNVEDVSMAVRYCKQNNIEHDLIDLDIDSFFEKEFFEKAEQGQSPYPNGNLMTYLLEKSKPEFPVLGTDPIGSGTSAYETYIRSVGNTVEVYMRSYYSPVYKWMIEHNVKGCPSFWLYNPELIAAYINHNRVLDYEKNFNQQKEKIPNLDLLRAYFYQTEWPELESRPKRTGFESICLTDFWKLNAFPKVLSSPAVRFDSKFYFTLDQLREWIGAKPTLDMCAHQMSL